MKSLKKTLCIVLVICMAVGMLGVGASAGNLTSFTDADDVGANYSTAVDLFAGLGIINGTTATTLEPQGNYTREQAAKVITYMMLGKTIADNLSTTVNPFDDVKATRWSAGYIAYCVGEGVIDGYGDGNFGPADQLTGYQWSKMLLVALGIGSEEEYTGAQWSINVAKDAFTAGIYKGDTAAASNAPITREQAILLGFNAFFYGTEVTTAKTLYLVAAVPAGTAPANVGLTYETSAAAITAAGAAVLGIDYTLIPVSGTVTSVTDSLAKDVYKVTAVTASDDFGRSITNYTVAGKIKSTGVVAATLTYTTAVTQAKIFADLGLTTTPATAAMYTDGVLSSQSIGYNVATAIPGTGNGVLTEVYYNADTGAIKIVLINTYAGKVGTVTPATAVAKAKIEVLADTTAPAAYATKTFETTGLAKDTVILYTAAYVGTDWVIKSVAAATSQTLTPASYTTSNFKADSTTYSYSKMVSDKVAGFGATVAYFDSYGYVIDTTSPTTVPNYAYVIALGSATDAFLVTTNYAKLLYTDGTTETVVTAADYSDYTAGAYTNADLTGEIVVWSNGTGANSGKIVLAPNAASTIVASSALTLNTGAATFTWSGSKVANANTIFVVASGSPTVYSVYTGIANVPSYSGTIAGAVYPGTSAAAVVFLDHPTPESAITTNKIFCTGVATEVFVTGGSYFLTTAIVNGVEQELMLAANPGLGVFTTMATAAVTGYVTLSNEIATGTDFAAQAITAASAGVITINSVAYGYTADCVAYRYNATTGALTATTIEAITAGTYTGYIVQTVAGGPISAIYLAQ